MSLDFLSLRDYRQEEHSITHERRKSCLGTTVLDSSKNYSSGYSPVLFQTLTGSHRCSIYHRKL